MTGDGRRSPRLDPVADPTPEVAALLAKTMLDENGEALHVFSTLARHPRLLKRLNALGGLFVVHGELPARERELVVLRTAWSCGSVYEWGQHVLLGRRAALTEQEIAQARVPFPTFAGRPTTPRCWSSSMSCSPAATSRSRAGRSSARAGRTPS